MTSPALRRLASVDLETIADDLLAALSIGAEDPRALVRRALARAVLEEQTACALTCENLAEEVCERLGSEYALVARLTTAPMDLCANAIRTRSTL